MTTGRPKQEDYVDLHEWAQAMKVWNERNNVTSDDLVRQWNEGRKRS